jgi:hypothetical protein
MGALALAILFYYEGTHGTVHEMREREPNLKLYDDELLSMDRFMLGWLFPDGQLSLWADENRFIGPESLIGPLLTEILQISYARYRPHAPRCDCCVQHATPTHTHSDVAFVQLLWLVQRADRVRGPVGVLHLRLHRCPHRLP